MLGTPLGEINPLSTLVIILCKAGNQFLWLRNFLNFKKVLSLEQSRARSWTRAWFVEKLSIMISIPDARKNTEWSAYVLKVSLLLRQVLLDGVIRTWLIHPFSLAILGFTCSGWKQYGSDVVRLSVYDLCIPHRVRRNICPLTRPFSAFTVIWFTWTRFRVLSGTLCGVCIKAAKNVHNAYKDSTVTVLRLSVMRVRFVMPKLRLLGHCWRSVQFNCTS